MKYLNKVDPSVRRSVPAVLLIMILISFVSCGSEFPASVEDPSQWKLVWNEEFDYEGAPDPEKWVHEILPPGAFNQELQAYRDNRENSRVEDGTLIIEARHIEGTRRGYTSARMTTRFSMNMYLGRIEVRAKLPTALGTWPAIWMLPVSSEGRVGWPHSGEIDIMEHVGYDNGVVHASVHTSLYNHPNGNHPTATARIDGVGEEFHIYALEWTEEHLDFFIDERLVMRYENDGTGYESYPFDRPFYLILNIAVGGQWGGLQGVDVEQYPARMEVDFVRVYEAR
jgi:beta-glucanase (GH16 family)